MNPTPKNCALAPHPKTIMLNSDMAQNFPIAFGTGAVTPTNPKGLIGELCAPFVVSRTATNFKAMGKEMFPTNTAVQTSTGVWQTTSFGCVMNTIGDGRPGNKQTIISTKLVTDPANAAVNLFACKYLLFLYLLHMRACMYVCMYVCMRYFVGES